MSLGYLKRNDFSFSFHSKSGVLNIIKGSMMVLRGKRLENNLFQIMGSVVDGGSDAAAVTNDQ